MPGICVANASSPDVHWEVQWGRKAVGFTTAADTLWCQSWSLTTTKFPVLLCESIEGVCFAKVSSNTPRPHTPCRLKFTLRSLTQVTVLHFVLRLSFYQTHDFLKMSSISHPATVFLFCNLSCTRNLTKPHCFGEENEKIFPGARPPDPLPSSDTTQTPPPASPLDGD